MNDHRAWADREFRRIHRTVTLRQLKWMFGWSAIVGAGLLLVYLGYQGHSMVHWLGQHGRKILPSNQEIHR